MAERVPLRELRLRARASHGGDELGFWTHAWSLDQYPRPWRTEGGQLVPAEAEYELLDGANHFAPLPPEVQPVVAAGEPVAADLLATLLPDALIADAAAVVRWSGGFGRVMFETEPELQQWPFERALRQRLGAGWAGARACLVRRRHGQPGRAPAGFPFTVRTVGDVPEQHVFGDHFVADAQTRGGFALVREATPVAAAVLHVAGSTRPDDVPPVRLLVFHRVGPVDLPAEDLLAQHAETGDHAVLVVDEPAPSEFFATFYRKLLHDWPLDRCLEAGLDAGVRQGVAAWLSLRPGAETDLLLSQLVAERAGVLTLSDYPREDAPFLEQHEMAMGADDSGPLATNGPARSPAVVPSRMERIREEVLRHTRAVAEVARDAVACGAESLSNLSFALEGHSLSSLLGGEDELRSLADRVTRVEGARDAVAETDDVALQDATTRFTQAWLERPGAAAPLAEGTFFRLGEALTLKVQIRAEKLAGVFGEAFPQAALAELTDVDRGVDLTVRFFHDGRLELDRELATLHLEPVGDSSVAETRIVPRRPGRVALRVALYFGNVLLQSLAVSGCVVAGDDDAAPREGGLRVRRDYVATPDFLLLDELEQPAVSLFTNDAAGTHWLGVYRAEDATLRTSAPQELSSDLLEAAMNEARRALGEAHGTPESGVYNYQSPLSDGPERLAREARLKALAVAGWTLYDALFYSNPDADETTHALAEALRAPSLVSVARCDSEAPSAPWSALYDYPLDTGAPGALTWCPQAAGEIDGGLADPVACRARAECPLAAPETEETTVCPYGFWGLRHRIEQPLDALPEEADTADEVGAELGVARERSRLVVSGEKVRLVFGFDPELPVAGGHGRDLAAVSDALALVAYDDRAKLRQALRAEDAPLFYMLCHGVLENSVFKLVLRSQGKQVTLSQADLRPQPGAKRGPFLVVLNACDSVATRPDLLHLLPFKLRSLGAVGVVGTEIPVAQAFAVDFGRRLVAGLLAEKTIGETFLEIRKDLMRALNPSGLLYTYHSVAALKVVRGDGRAVGAEHTDREHAESGSAQSG